MAEITTTNSNSKKGLVKRIIKKSTRVDLTPMVDLGFLLVTFFVFTTTMAQPKAMNIYVPNDKNPGSKDEICESCALTLVLGNNNQIFYYEGLEKNADYKQTNYAADGIRKIIMDKKRKLKELDKNKDMVLIIKSSDKSSVQNLVNVIDESNISMIKRFYMAELNEKDKVIAQ